LVSCLTISDSKGVFKIRYPKKPLEVNYDSAKDKALRLLEFRSHSEGELRQKLKIYGANSEDIEKVVEFLLEYKFLNDETYAIRLANDLHNIKKFGKRRIEQELFRKGISREIIALATSEIEDNDKDMLLPLMEKKLGGDFTPKSRDRAFRYFVSRGYSFDDIKSVFDNLKELEG